MSKESELPWFNTARGPSTLAAVPPFDFDGVTIRLFPLRANIETLTHFCDQYLNIMPPEIAYFRPAVPYVYLALIHYGRMRSEIRTEGWVPQREIPFGLPLAWYRRVNGRMEFQDWASFSPFIFVDDFRSLASGREIYGWPKQDAEVTPEVDAWSIDPRAPESLVSLSTSAFDRALGNRGAQPIRAPRRDRLMDVVRLPRMDAFEFPLAVDGEVNPFAIVPRAGYDALSIVGRFWESVLSSPVRGYPPRAPQDISDMLERWAHAATRLCLNTVNLKQFRHAVEPWKAAYQSLNRSEMVLKRVNRYGFFSDVRRVIGDPAAGFRIRLYRPGASAVIDTLGLIPDETSEPEERAAVTFRPCYPFWIDVDLGYGRGRTICSRSQGVGPAVSPWTVHSESGKTRVIRPRRGDRGEYNTARAARLGAIGGPLKLLVNAVRVLPLIARPEKLDDFVNAYLNDGNPGAPYRAWGRFVFLSIADFRGVETEYSGDIGGWVRRQLAFAVPVRRENRGGAEERGFVFPYMYVDSPVYAVHERETVGVPATEADLRSPPNSWASQFQPWESKDDDKGDDQEPFYDRSILLRMRTNVLASLFPGQKQKRETLIEVSRLARTPPEQLGAYEEAIKIYEGDRNHVLKHHHDEYCALKKRARDFLDGERDLSRYSLKQFRHVDAPDRAAYAALVRTDLGFFTEKLPGRSGPPDRQGPPASKTSPPTFKYNLFHARGTTEPAGGAFQVENGDVYAAHEVRAEKKIQIPISVGIYKFASEPIVDALGLIPYAIDDSGKRTVHHFLAHRPFIIQADIRLNAKSETPWGGGPDRACTRDLRARTPRVEPQMVVEGLLTTKLDAVIHVKPPSPRVDQLVQLNAKQSETENPGEACFTWHLVGPRGARAALKDPTTLTPTFCPDVAGRWTVTLVIDPCASRKRVSAVDQTIVVSPKNASSEPTAKK